MINPRENLQVFQRFKDNATEKTYVVIGTRYAGYPPVEGYDIIAVSDEGFRCYFSFSTLERKNYIKLTEICSNDDE